jgi:hypothetical protein
MLLEDQLGRIEKKRSQFAILAKLFGKLSSADQSDARTNVSKRTVSNARRMAAGTSEERKCTAWRTTHFPRHMIKQRFSTHLVTQEDGIFTRRQLLVGHACCQQTMSFY